MSKIGKYTMCEFQFSDGKLEIMNPPSISGRYRVLRGENFPGSGTRIVFEDYAHYDTNSKKWANGYPCAYNQINDVIAYREEASIAFDMDRLHFNGKQPYLTKTPEYKCFVNGYTRAQIKNEILAKHHENNKKDVNLVLATMEYQDVRLHDMLIIATASINGGQVLFSMEKKDETNNYSVGRKSFSTAIEYLKTEMKNYAKETEE